MLSVEKQGLFSELTFHRNTTVCNCLFQLVVTQSRHMGDCRYQINQGRDGKASISNGMDFLYYAIALTPE